MGGNSKGIRNFLWIISAAVLTSPLFFYFDQQGKPGTGRAAWVCALVFLIVLKVRWGLKSRPWFWITITALLALHFPLILFVPWTSSWIPAVGIWPLAVLDCAIILGCIAVVEKLMKRSDEVGSPV
jgi:hypothetical protein